MSIIYIIYFSSIIFLSLFFSGVFWGVGWFPTKKEDYDRIAKLAYLEPGLIFYDLGSGTGNMLFYLSKKYNIKCVGIEISPILYLYSKIKSLFYNRVKICYGNFFKYDLSKADIVYAFLHPKLYDKLKEKINNGMRDDSKIILACWPFEALTPINKNKKEHKVTYYLYKKPF